MNEYAALYRDQNSKKYSYEAIWDADNLVTTNPAGIYSSWDADKITGCVCDGVHKGFDCDRRFCPKGDDPLTKNQQNEVQIFICLLEPSEFVGGAFNFIFDGKPSPLISINDGADEMKAALESIEGITNININYDSGISTTICSEFKNVFEIEFREQFGPQPPLVVQLNDVLADTSGQSIPVVKLVGTGGNTNDDEILENQSAVKFVSKKGSKENDECSGRGTCDTALGVCACYDSGGNRYESSDGYGQRGSRADCGKIQGADTVTNCPGGTPCSNRGVCDSAAGGAFKCSCAEGWSGGDCTQRMCPKGASWFDYPTGNEVAHREIAECSDKGHCKAETGECDCQMGYFGQACEFMTCPGGIDFPCNLNGQCLSVYEMAQYSEVNGDDALVTYGRDVNLPLTWDAKRIHHCVCDEGFGNFDCSDKVCPRGDDPETKNQKTERQVFKCKGDSPDSTFKISFRKKETQLFAPTALLEDIQEAFNGMSSMFKPTVQFVLTDGTEEGTTTAPSSTPICSKTGDPDVYVVVDLKNHGNVPDIQFDLGDPTSGGLRDTGNTAIGNPGAITLFKSGAEVNSYVQSWDGETENIECSGRGHCDILTGTCKCFRGYGSSDGLGNMGDFGDCGFIHDAPPKTTETYDWWKRVLAPTSMPTSNLPTSQPSSDVPSGLPSSRPSAQPVAKPTSRPSNQPSGKPTGQPVAHPSHQPTSQPTS
jgi:hypothetical protein